MAKKSAGNKLGQRLRQLREAGELTQAQLAERLDVEQSVISRWESGARVPTWDNIQALSLALGVTCEAFRTLGDDV